MKILWLCRGYFCNLNLFRSYYIADFVILNLQIRTQSFQADYLIQILTEQDAD